jgi:uncharacterized protein YgbK (DUF1537 family)
MKLCVIADDLTGAAEIAGLGLRYGLAARLVREPFVPDGCGEGLTVLDTDSRALTPEAAAARVREACAAACASGFGRIYKKTDSALRGPLLAEVGAALEALGMERALLVPQNPSRGRTVSAGRYASGGVPLHLTEFGRDPEHPATSDDVAELLGARDGALPVAVLDPGAALPSCGVAFGCAADAAEVRGWASQLDARTLPAGGADFFQAVLEAAGLRVCTSPAPQAREGRALAVCGSASEESRRAVQQAGRSGVRICRMPASVFGATDGATAAQALWREEAARALRESGAAVLTVGRPCAGGGHGCARRLAEALADAAASALAEGAADELLLEGGATAAAVARKLGWHAFHVCEELAPGVVGLRPVSGGPRVTFKPGSYPWPAGLPELLGRAAETLHGGGEP